MKKLLFILSAAVFLSLAGCGGSTENASKDQADTVITPQVQQLEKSSQDVKSESEKVKMKADSILNNI
jgi:hypothetical protein